MSQDSTSMPYFERIGNDDFNELQSCRIVIENQQQRLMILEKINVDLELRLEDQAKQSMAVEKECVAIETKWKKHCEERDMGIEALNKALEKEKSKGDRLREHLSRTERELYGILQRKYEIMRGPAVGGRNGTFAQNRLNQNSNGGDLSTSERQQSPSASWLEFSNTAKANNKNSNTFPNSLESKKAREAQAERSLADFLGF